MNARNGRAPQCDYVGSVFLLYYRHIRLLFIVIKDNNLTVYNDV